MPSSGSSSLATLKGRNAAAARWHRPDRDEVAREYAAARLADYIARTVATAPPLTDEQAERIAALLRPAGGS